MAIVVAPQPLVSAYVVFFGQHGQVTRYAQQCGVSRQVVYRQAAALHQRLQDSQHTIAALQQQLQDLRQHLAVLEQRLQTAVLLDEDKQAEFASLAQARGVSLLDCWELLQVLLPGRTLSRATLGRRTQALAQQAGRLLAVLDERTRPKVQDVLADEIYVSAPVLMTVEPESLCWLGARYTDSATVQAWVQELGCLPNLQQVTRDAGKALTASVAALNRQRQQQQQAPLFDQGDHFHALRGRGSNLHWYQVRAGQALAKAEAAQKKLAACARQGRPCGPLATRARAAWRRAEQAMDRWSELERLWQRTKEALPLFTATGDLNTRARAEAVLAETLPQLPEQGFAKSKRALQKPEMLSYLDRVQQQSAALPFAAEVTAAAWRQEGLRRRADLLCGDNQQAAARRGVLLVCAVVLHQAGAAGVQAVAAVRELCGRCYRASSLVECVNSVLRMQQARHRRLSQGLLDLKRLYWNSHSFRTGRRRQTTPYQRLGVPWPENLSWGELLKLTPEQLREKLSTPNAAA